MINRHALAFVASNPEWMLDPSEKHVLAVTQSNLNKIGDCNFKQFEKLHVLGKKPEMGELEKTTKKKKRSGRKKKANYEGEAENISSATSGDTCDEINQSDLEMALRLPTALNQLGQHPRQCRVCSRVCPNPAKCSECRNRVDGWHPSNAINMDIMTSIFGASRGLGV